MFRFKMIKSQFSYAGVLFQFKYDLPLLIFDCRRHPLLDSVTAPR